MPLIMSYKLLVKLFPKASVLTERVRAILTCLFFKWVYSSSRYFYSVSLPTRRPLDARTRVKLFNSPVLELNPTRNGSFNSARVLHIPVLQKGDSFGQTFSKSLFACAKFRGIKFINPSLNLSTGIAPWCSGQACGTLDPATGVRIPAGLPFNWAPDLEPRLPFHF